MKPYISIVIPAYNEVDNLKKGSLEQVNNYFKDKEYRYEVLVVDDGSSDETVEVVKKKIVGFKNFRLIEMSHAGKALTVMNGLLLTEGEYAVFTDMDQATPINQIEKVLPKFKQGFDIVIGARSGRKGAPFIRKLSAWGFSMIRNIFLGLPFIDTQCGFKAFNRRSIELIFPELIKRWEAKKISGVAVNAGFDVEMLFVARKKGLKIADVAVEWQYVESERVPFLKNAFEATVDVLNIRINDILGKYD